MTRPAVQHPPGDVHEWAKVRFSAAFGDAGDAVLTTETGEVLMCIGPLANTVAHVGGSFAELPTGISSTDLRDRLAYVQESPMRTTTAHLELATGIAVAARMFTMISEDVHRRYVVVVLTKDVGSDEIGRLRRHGQVYELLFERAPSGICLVGIDGVYISANPAYCRLVGRSERELKGMNFQDITHPDDLSLDSSLGADLLAKRIDRYDIDKRYLRPDGSVLWGHLTVALLEDDDGTPQFFIAMIEDITERRRVQEELQTTSELWRTTFELARVAMVEIEVDGTIRRANRAAGELMGCEPAELIGHRTVDLADPVDYEEGVANLQRFARGELKSNISERRLIDRHGRLRWLSVYTAAVAGRDGSTDRLLMQVLDVTEERELRDRLQLSFDELSHAYREKVALMTAVSHDLRTPLAAIRILAELLVSNDKSITEADRAELARRLLVEAARTENVLGDMVASERASAGLITPRRIAVDLNELVRTTVESEVGEHTTHEVVLRPASEDVTMLVDPALVGRMIANLVSNTLRHTRPGTTVWVSVAIDDTQREEQKVRVVVEDDGPGVPDAMKEAIFEPFVRGTDDRPGSGIGLFLVRRFAEFHGGTVVCTDRDGGGASFCVTLPRS